MLSRNAAYDIALALSLGPEPADRDTLMPLAELSLVWADRRLRRPLAIATTEALWAEELREDIERALDLRGELSSYVAGLRDAAVRDLARGPTRSLLAREVVERWADELAWELQRPIHCILCVEDGIAAAAEADRPRCALAVARIAGHAAEIPHEELRIAVVASARHGDASVAAALATEERRAAVRAWLRRLAALGRDSVPTISAALEELLGAPAPPSPHEDEVWQEAVRGLVETPLEAALN